MRIRTLEKCGPGGAVRRLGRLVAAIALACALASRGSPAEAADRPVICLIGGTGADGNAAAFSRLERYLERELPGKYLRVLGEGREADGAALRAALDAAEVAVLFAGQAGLTAGDLEAVREFVARGHGLALLRPGADAPETWQKFQEEVAGARNEGVFPVGARLATLCLYPHAIFTTEADRFETRENLPRTTVKDDAVIIMEGEVGEASVPMAWLRSYQRGRVFRFLPGADALFDDPAYLKITANGIRWAAGRKIPGARISVQRTYMADAHPGAFAILFPDGPAVCYDPDHGGIAYAWAGDFVDPRRWYTARHGAAMKDFAARFAGEVFYREDLAPAFRAGAGPAAAEFRYLGFQLARGYPEFRYKVGGRIVTESLQATPDGLGLVRHYTVGAGPDPLTVAVGLPDRAAQAEGRAIVTVAGATLAETGDRVRFASTGEGAFTVTIRRQEAPRSNRP